MLEIREVTIDDLPEVEQLLSCIWADTYATFLSDKIIHHVTRLWENPELLRVQIENPHAHFLMATHSEGTVVGLSTASEDEAGTILLDRLYVHPHFQRHGIGSQLIEESVRRFPGAKAIHLEMEEKDIKGVKFYQKLGFSIIEKREDNAGEGVLTVLIMEKTV